MTNHEICIHKMKITDNIQIAAARLKKACEGLQKFFEENAIADEHKGNYRKLQNDLQIAQTLVTACFVTSYNMEIPYLGE